MNLDPASNLARNEKLRARVLAHPLCFRLEEEPGMIRVIFPEGDFRTNGVQVRGMATYKAFERLLVVMERFWLESYPAPKGNN